MRRLPRLRTDTIAVLDCFLVLGVLGLYLKFGLLDGQWTGIARFVGKLHAWQLSPWQRVGFFAEDVVLNLVAIPLLATPVVCLLFRRYRLAAGALIPALLSVYYFFQLRAHAEVGQYMSRALMLDAVHWGISNPGMTSSYVDAVQLAKLAFLLLVIVVIVVVARFGSKEADTPARFALVRRCRLALWVPAAVVIAASVVLTPVAYMARLFNSPLNVSSVRRIATDLIGAGSSSAASRLTFQHPLDAFRKLTHTPPLDTGSAMVGSERGDDVIVYVMETGPDRALDYARDGRDLPGAGQLIDHAFIATHHYTTYPYTSNALWSIVSGLYPAGRRSVLSDPKVRGLNGLMTALSDDYPVRRVYMPSLYLSEVDDRMYPAFGAETLYVADEHNASPLRAPADARAKALIARLERSGSHFDGKTRALLFERLRFDFQALARMQQDMIAAAKHGQRYCVIYMPQIAHGPWIALHNEPTVIARGRALMLLEDEWLKEIVDTVRGLGRLDHTVILVTADHGIRTRAEDPALAVGKISDYMFHVPLLIYAPHLLQHTDFITAPTSHIDLTPTLLALLGKTADAERMQGIPIWQRAPDQRLYFWAQDYGNADGYEQDGVYYMRQSLSGEVYRSDNFNFSDDQLAPKGSPLIERVDHAIDQATVLQHALADQLLRQRQ